MNIDHLFEPHHPTVIHCTGVPGSSRDFFINCLAHHPAVHVNMGEHYLFNSYQEQVLFLSRHISAQKAAGVNNTKTTNKPKIPGPQLLNHCANRNLITIAASNSVDSFGQIHELFPTAKLVMPVATKEYLGVHADQYEEQGQLMGQLIGNYALQIYSDKFLTFETFLPVWNWVISVLGLDPVLDSNTISSLERFHSQYITTRSSVDPVLE